MIFRFFILKIFLFTPITTIANRVRSSLSCAKWFATLFFSRRIHFFKIKIKKGKPENEESLLVALFRPISQVRTDWIRDKSVFFSLKKRKTNSRVLANLVNAAPLFDFVAIESILDTKRQKNIYIKFRTKERFVSANQPELAPNRSSGRRRASYAAFSRKKKEEPQNEAASEKNKNDLLLPWNC